MVGGMSTAQFLKDRQRGRIIQDWVAAMFSSWGWQVENVPDGMFGDYDLVVMTPEGKRRTVEIKYDQLACTTGRLCLELEALEHSRADFLAIVTDNPRTVYITPLQEALIFAEQYPGKRRVGEYGVIAALPHINTFISQVQPQILRAN